MSTKQKIIKSLVLLLLCGLLVSGVVAANYYNKSTTLSKVEIKVSDTSAGSFLTKQDIFNMLVVYRNIATGITRVKDIDLAQMEKIANSNPWIDSANIFVTANRTLSINVTMKKPVLRLLNGDDAQYYLDAKGKIIPLSLEHPVDVPVVTANNIKFDSKDCELLKQMVSVATQIVADTFWNNMVSQINVNSEREFELIPMIGKHKILIGDATNLTDKLARVFAFYKYACAKVGWDTYGIIDARFAGQIVADSAKVFASQNSNVVSAAEITTNAVNGAASESNTTSTPIIHKTSVAAPSKPKTNSAQQAKPETKHTAQPTKDVNTVAARQVAIKNTHVQQVAVRQPVPKQAAKSVLIKPVQTKGPQVKQTNTSKK